MAAANITYLGALEDSADLHWGVFDFPIGTVVLVDPDTVSSNGERIFYEHIIMKAKKNPYFTVEDVAPAGRKAKAKDRDDEDDGEDEENGNGDYDLSALPKDWRSLHHKKIIAIAKRLGGEGEDLATRDGAISYIEEQLALGVPQKEDVPF